MGFDRHVLIQYAPNLLDGLWTTLGAVGLTWAIASALGLLACMAALSRLVIARALARVYVNVFRVVPDLVLIFWIYYCFPFLYDLRLSGLASGVIALSLTTGAYLAEIIRAGVVAVPAGQIEAARSLALGFYARWRCILLPQALRRMLPALINALTDLLKHTTLLAGIGVAELTYQAYTLGAQTFRYFEFLSVIAVAYFVVMFPLSLMARRMEVSLRQRTAN